jgi:hypothetical protein
MNRSGQPQPVRVATVFTALYFPNQYYDTHGGKSPLPHLLYRLWADRGMQVYRPIDNMLGKEHNE